MRVRSLATLTVLLVAALSGCIGDPEAEPGATSQNGDAANDTKSPTATQPLPDGREGNLTAFDETNKTEEGKGGLDHHHDYWEGRTEVEIYKGHHEMNPAPYTSGTDAIVRMPEGSLVYEGTERLTVTISNPGRHVCYERFIGTINGKNTCTDSHGFQPRVPAGPTIPDPNPPAVELQYRHAAANDWMKVGPVTWGQPQEILIGAPLETDMPHSTTSLWQFRLVSPSVLETTLVFDISVKVFRGAGDIPLWPGHPDFYATGHYRLIFDGKAITKDYGQRNYNALTPSEVTTIKPDRLISYGTKTLYVYINITSYKGTPGFEPHNWYLLFHNASGDWNITDLSDPNNTVGSAKELLFVLPVDSNAMDTPYASASRWEFQLRGTYNAGGLGCYLDCADYEVEYTATIIATDLPPTRPYTCGGVGDDWCPS